MNVDYAAVVKAWLRRRGERRMERKDSGAGAKIKPQPGERLAELPSVVRLKCADRCF